MNANKRAGEFASVSDMLEFQGEHELKEQVEEQLCCREVISRLITLRIVHDVSQADVAREIGCTQSRISKLEQSVDADLKIGDIAAYAHCCGVQANISFEPLDCTLMDRVKFHALSINDLLKTMCKLSAGDSDMERGSVGAHLETIMNMTGMVVQSMKSIPDAKKHLSEFIKSEPVGETKGKSRSLNVVGYNEEACQEPTCTIS